MVYDRTEWSSTSNAILFGLVLLLTMLGIYRIGQESDGSRNTLCDKEWTGGMLLPIHPVLWSYTFSLPLPLWEELWNQLKSGSLESCLHDKSGRQPRARPWYPLWRTQSLFVAPKALRAAVWAPDKSRWIATVHVQLTVDYTSVNPCNNCWNPSGTYIQWDLDIPRYAHDSHKQ